jgi:PilZ domain
MAALAHSIPTSEQDAERRSEARYPTQDPAELELLNGPADPIYGTVLDVSRSGLRVALAQRIDRGEQVKVKLHDNVIFGEVRYCRAVSGAFQAGIKIQDLVRPSIRNSQHIADDPLSLYAVGKGLSVPEVIDVREHLVRCDACRHRLAAKEAMLNPYTQGKRRRSLGPQPRA